MPLCANPRVRHAVVCLDEFQATRTPAYALFDDTDVLHTFYQYLTRSSVAFRRLERARLIQREARDALSLNRLAAIECGSGS
jgi:hypothetical protein